MLFENALEHEEEVVKGLYFETPTGDSLEQRAVGTIDLMSRGVDRIFQGVLLLAKESGIPDLLEKVPGSRDLATSTTSQSTLRPRLEVNMRINMMAPFATTPLVLVTPRTVVNWHRAGFRLYWTWISRVRQMGGRQRVCEEVRADESTYNSKPKSLRQAGRNLSSEVHKDLANYTCNLLHG
jgi:hypothetical protein